MVRACDMQNYIDLRYEFGAAFYAKGFRFLLNDQVNNVSFYIDVTIGSD